MMHSTAAAKTFDGLGLVFFQMVASLLVTSWTSQAGFFSPPEIFSNSLAAYYCFLALLMMARQKHGSSLAVLLSVIRFIGHICEFAHVFIWVSCINIMVNAQSAKLLSMCCCHELTRLTAQEV